MNWMFIKCGATATSFSSFLWSHKPFFGEKIAFIFCFVGRLLASFIHSFIRKTELIFIAEIHVARYWNETSARTVHIQHIHALRPLHFQWTVRHTATQTQSAIVYETALNRICRVGHTTMRTVVETRRLYKWKRLSARRRRRRSFESQPKNEILNAYRLHTHTHVRNESFLLRHTSHPTRFHSPIFAW